MNGVRSCSGGALPPLTPGLWVPPLPLLTDVRLVRWLMGECPTFLLYFGYTPPLSHACHLLVVHASVQRGIPPSSSPRLRVGVLRLPVGVFPSLPAFAHGARAAVGGVSPPLPPLAARWGSSRPLWGVPLAPLTALGLRALLGRGFPSRLPLVATRLGRALPFLVIPLRPLAARSWRALLGETPPLLTPLGSRTH